jgi:hypothetical protein
MAIATKSHTLVLTCLLLGALGTGCPGEYEGRRPKYDTIAISPDWGVFPDTGLWQLPDLGGGSDADGSPPAADHGPKDSTSKTDKPLNTTPGGPCPCASPLICVAGYCRKTCTKKPCNAPGGCLSTEACVTTQSGSAVCVPGVGKGKTCSADVPCVDGHLCLASSSGGVTGKCYATCTTAGQTCSVGGTCSTLEKSSCLFCYP